MDTNKLLEDLASCEAQTRELVRRGDLQALEQPLRAWQTLLDQGQRELAPCADLSYFTMVFCQINGALYQNSGRTRQMEQAFLEGKKALAQLADQLPLEQDPSRTPERALTMAFNGAEFGRLASLALETGDMAAAWELLEASVRLYDWLWPVLPPQAAVTAAEVHLKAASLLILYKEQQDQAARELELVKERFLDLYRRTGDQTYAQRAEHTALGTGRGGTLTPEQLKSNPALAQVYRTAQQVDKAGEALDQGRQEEAAFLFRKAAQEAEKMLEALDNRESRYVALVAFWGGALCQQDSDPDRARQLAQKGLLLAAGFREELPAGLSARELRSMEKDFNRIAGNRQKRKGFLGLFR